MRIDALPAHSYRACRSLQYFASFVLQNFAKSRLFPSTASTEDARREITAVSQFLRVEFCVLFLSHSTLLLRYRTAMDAWVATGHLQAAAATGHPQAAAAVGWISIAAWIVVSVNFVVSESKSLAAGPVGSS